jgi:hypothetical protein
MWMVWGRLWVCITYSQRRDERGDVPGWVLVTIMTAGLVTMLWRFAGPELKQMLDDALSQVTG